ncbi:hypothetical protein DO97_13150 [Neosynechococcus sphagnicola sy1]|uniref:Uncharacterized protein n=2 Tax=Neosynechococcus TaxID=1501143 RepID=A0A098TIY7_9CYAN|nr:hypothetical protein DO97_13150 [Neosynechococcus sphagnicola sy1]
MVTSAIGKRQRRIERWLVFTLFLGLVGCASSPEVVTVTTGASRRVANGRAELWLGEVSESWRDDLNGIVDSAQIELNCNGQAYPQTVFNDKPSEVTCGVQVRLVEIPQLNPPKARLEILW